MDSSLTHAKIFVTEDSYSKVSVDGQPHGVMTIVACVLGVIAACIILAILTSMTECRINRRAKKEKLQNAQQTEISIINVPSNRTSSMSTISVGAHSNASSKSIDICTCNGNKIGKECKRAISLEAQSSVSERSSVNSQQSNDEFPIVKNAQQNIQIKKMHKQKDTCGCGGKSAEKPCRRTNSGKVNFAFENEKPSMKTTPLEKIELQSQISNLTVDIEKATQTSIDIERF